VGETVTEVVAAGEIDTDALAVFVVSAALVAATVTVVAEDTLGAL
jgi:hypothetical protein